MAPEKSHDKKEESGGFMDTINSMAGGGKSSEKQEDTLDKGMSSFLLQVQFWLKLTFCLAAVDFVQEKILGQGKQNNESAAEQAKDEAISDYIRDKYNDVTGTDFPVEDKDKKYGL